MEEDSEDQGGEKRQEWRKAGLHLAGGWRKILAESTMNHRRRGKRSHQTRAVRRLKRRERERAQTEDQGNEDLGEDWNDGIGREMQKGEWDHLYGPDHCYACGHQNPFVCGCVDGALRVSRKGSDERGKRRRKRHGGLRDRRKRRGVQ